MEEELLNELRSRALEADPELLQFLQSICKNSRITVEDTVNSYEAVVMKYGKSFQHLRLEQLRDEINKEISTIKGSAAVMAHRSITPSPPTKRTSPSKLPFKDSSGKKGRAIVPQDVPPHTPIQLGPLGKHQLVTHNPHLSNLVNPLASFNIGFVEGVSQSYMLLGDTNQKRRGAMLQKAAHFIRNAFPDLASLFKKEIELVAEDQQENYSEPPPPGEMEEGEEKLDELVGMIMPIQCVMEGADNDRLLNEASAGLLVLVENGKRPRSLKVYKLSFMELQEYKFYAGQFVRLRGYLQFTDLAGDASMKKLSIREVVPPQPLLKADQQSLKDRKAEWEGDKKTPPLKMIVAAGPFFREDSIDLSLLQKIGIKAKETGANAIVLMGPFLPKDNKYVKDGLFAVLAKNGETHIFYTYQEYVREMIDTVQKELGGLTPHFLLIPSPEDQASMTGHPLPQPALFFNQLNESKPFLREALFTLPNPSIVTFNDVLVGLINADVVKDLVAYSFVKTREDEQGKPKMKQNAVLPMLFENNSFFPVFPSSSAPVALSEWRGLEIKEAPDLLLTSSNYLPFFRTMEIDVLGRGGVRMTKEVGVLNPVKAVVGGVVEISISPPSDTTESVVGDRVRIDTLQI